ncbi:MAG TPA: HEAT repeat domain-containing protein [Nitrospirota bacterium]
MRWLTVGMIIVLSVCGQSFAETEGLPRPGMRQAAITESLKDQDPVVRQTAARTLGEAHEKSAVPALSEAAAKDPDETVRLTAIGALSVIGDRSAMPAYVKALKDEAEKVRQSAAEALSGMWDESAHQALIEALRTDISPKVRRSAAQALGNPGIMGRYQAHHWEQDKPDSEGSLMDALKKDESPEVRAMSASMLANFKTGRSLDPLIDALADKNASVRASAAEALGVLDKPRSVEKLLDVLYFEKDDYVVLNALKSLKYAVDPRLAGAAIGALRSSSQRVRWQAIDVLETLRTQDAVEPLKSLSEDKYESDGIKNKAREALQLLGQ